MHCTVISEGMRYGPPAPCLRGEKLAALRVFAISSTPWPVHTIFRLVLANALSMNSRTECDSPVGDPTSIAMAMKDMIYNTEFKRIAAKSRQRIHCGEMRTLMSGIDWVYLMICKAYLVREPARKTTIVAIGETRTPDE